MEMIGTGVLTCAIQKTQDSKTSKKWCFIIQTTSIFFSSELSCFDEEVVAGTMSLVAGTMSLVAGTMVAGTMSLVAGTMSLVDGTDIFFILFPRWFPCLILFSPPPWFVSVSVVTKSFVLSTRVSSQRGIEGSDGVLVKYKSPHYKSTHGDDIFFGMVIGEKNGRLKVVAPSARCVELIGEQIQTGWDSSCPHDTISVSSIICLESQLLTLEDTKAAEEDDKAAEEAAAEEAAAEEDDKAAEEAAAEEDDKAAEEAAAEEDDKAAEEAAAVSDDKAAEEAAAVSDDKAAEEAAAYERWLGSHPPLQPLQVGARRVSPRRTPGGDGQKK